MNYFIYMICDGVSAWCCPLATGPNIGVVITAGRSSEPEVTWQAARAAREGDVLLLAVGIGRTVTMAT